MTTGEGTTKAEANARRYLPGNTDKAQRLHDADKVIDIVDEISMLSQRELSVRNNTPSSLDPTPCLFSNHITCPSQSPDDALELASVETETFPAL